MENSKQIDKWIGEAEEIDIVYSNYDHCLCEDTKNKLMSGNFKADHTAWEFHGVIIFRGSRFIERIRRYGVSIAYYENDDIQDLINYTNENHGVD